MRRVKGRDTAPELAFRKALWARGLRYTLGNAALAGKPDLVLPRRRLVLFIDGDFWHGNQWRRRGHASLEEQFAGVHASGYWVPKIRRTLERDRRNTARLVADGWRVLRFWESDLTANLSGCVEQTVRAACEEPAACRAACPPERTFAAFFAGAGRVRLGLEREGWTAAVTFDREPFTRATNAQTCSQDAPASRCRADLPRLCGDDVPTVTLATASFPGAVCALASEPKRPAAEAPDDMPGFLDLLREMGERRPLLLMLDNGVGLLGAQGGEAFRRVLLALNALDYAVDAFVLDAAQFAPLSGPRLIIIGVQGLPATPLDEAQPPWLESALRPAALAQRMRAETIVRWRIMALPVPPPDATLEEPSASVPALCSDGDTACVSAIAWIADRYLNVVVSQLMRGRLLMQAS